VSEAEKIQISAETKLGLSKEAHAVTLLKNGVSYRDIISSCKIKFGSGIGTTKLQALRKKFVENTTGSETDLKMISLLHQQNIELEKRKDVIKQFFSLFIEFNGELRRSRNITIPNFKKLIKEQLDLQLIDQYQYLLGDETK